MKTPDLVKFSNLPAHHCVFYILRWSPKFDGIYLLRSESSCENTKFKGQIDARRHDFFWIKLELRCQI